MSLLGRFLEFSVRTPDILESLSFYKALGFSELAIGDVWTHRYAVVSDGEVCIGLHDCDFDSPSITFVHPDLAKYARNMSGSGIDFSVLRIDEDVFNEIGFRDRDGHMVRLLEARTFSPPEDDLERRQGRQRDPDLGVGQPLHPGYLRADRSLGSASRSPQGGGRAVADTRSSAVRRSRLEIGR